MESIGRQKDDSVQSVEIERPMEKDAYSNSCLKMIEDSLRSNSNNHKDFLNTLMRDIIGLKGKNNFYNFLGEKLKSKNLLYMRHGQAEHNYYNIYMKPKGLDRPDLFDPKLTEEGLEQCKKLVEYLSTLDINIEIVYTSPLRRALQTLEQIKTSLDNHSVTSFYVTELLREKLKKQDTHVGHQLSKLKEVFTSMDYLNYDFINKENWWSYEDDECCNKIVQKEDLNEFEHRLVMFIIWFIFRKENNACVVSHSRVYKTIMNLNEKQGEKKVKEKGAKHGGNYIIDREVLFSFVQCFVNKHFSDILI